MSTICVCGCAQKEHVGGLCLSTLDCLCRGYTAQASQPIPLGGEVRIQAPDSPLHGRRAVVVAYVQTQGGAPAMLLRLLPDEDEPTG